MSMHTRSQKLAHSAYARIAMRDKQDKEYASFAKRFPALIHTCGLAQAVAFAEAKGRTQDDMKKPELLYLEDLAAVLSQCGYDEINAADTLAQRTRDETLGGYLRLSRDAINAATWLKRYVEAAAPVEEINSP